MELFFKKICRIFCTGFLLVISINSYSSDLMNRDAIFQNESKIIDYSNAKNKAINFYIFGENYGDMSIKEIEKNKDTLNNIFDSSWVKRWVSDKQLDNSDLDGIYTYTNNILNGMATNKTNDNNVIAVNPIMINQEEDKIGSNNYWFNIIMFPRVLFENKTCIGTVLVFSPNDCLLFSDRWNELINEYLSTETNNQLNSDFVWSFISVHELSHSLPYQLNLRIFSERESEFKEPINKYPDLSIYYKEVYADLYATIKMLNYGYSKDDIKGIMLMRSFSLFLYDDINHYTNPYIKLLLDQPYASYNQLKNLDDINEYINNIFIKGYNLGYVPNIKIYNTEMMNIRNDVRKFNTFLISLSAATEQASTDSITQFIKDFNKRVYFSNARLRVRMNNY